MLEMHPSGGCRYGVEYALCARNDAQGPYFGHLRVCGGLYLEW